MAEALSKETLQLVLPEESRLIMQSVQSAVGEPTHTVNNIRLWTNGDWHSFAYVNTRNHYDEPVALLETEVGLERVIFRLLPPMKRMEQLGDGGAMVVHEAGYQVSCAYLYTKGSILHRLSFRVLSDPTLPLQALREERWLDHRFQNNPLNETDQERIQSYIRNIATYCATAADFKGYMSSLPGKDLPQLRAVNASIQQILQFLATVHESSGHQYGCNLQNGSRVLTRIVPSAESSRFDTVHIGMIPYDGLLAETNDRVFPNLSIGYATQQEGLLFLNNQLGLEEIFGSLGLFSKGSRSESMESNLSVAYMPDADTTYTFLFSTDEYLNKIFGKNKSSQWQLCKVRLVIGNTKVPADARLVKQQLHDALSLIKAGIQAWPNRIEQS